MDETIILKDLYESAAPEIKAVLSDDNKIEAIGNKHNLNVTQVSQLNNEIVFVLLGLEPLNSFRPNLMRELGITYDQAIKISSDVNDRIFGSVMNAVKALEKTEESPSVEENVVTKPHPEPVKKPDELLPDHDQLTKTDGPHTHTQSVPPVVASVTPTVAAPTATQVAKAPATVTPATTMQPKPAFKSIVDQKLSGLVRSSNAPTNLPTNLPMNEKDLEEMMKKSEGVKIGYKGIDPYREPIE